MNTTRAQMLAGKIGQAFKLARKRCPDETTLNEMGVQMAIDTVAIPDTHIVRCFEHARTHYDDTPTSRLVIRAWNQSIRPESAKARPEESATPAVQAQRPDEFWRDVVTARLFAAQLVPGISLPNMSDLLKLKSTQAPTIAEVDTFCRMIRETKSAKAIETWGANNPYHLTADQIRYGLPASESNESITRQQYEPAT